MGTLYIVGTPIGNLDDITLRALQTLRTVDLIAAEDTRRAARLLQHFEISKPVTSLFEHNEEAKIDHLLKLLETDNVALISEAGMPGLSDPGYRMIRAAIKHNVRVVPIPGPTAAVTALIASGLATDAFIFVGFLPRRSGERRKLLQELIRERRTLVCYEAPHRLQESLVDIQQVLGDRALVVGRELTKMYEEIWRGSVSGARDHYSAEVRGEITLVIEGAPQAALKWDEKEVRNIITQAMQRGISRAQAVREIAEIADWPRREVYKIALTLSNWGKNNDRSK